jgi:hypothetical protein
LIRVGCVVKVDKEKGDSSLKSNSLETISSLYSNETKTTKKIKIEKEQNFLAEDNSILVRGRIR